MSARRSSPARGSGALIFAGVFAFISAVLVAAPASLFMSVLTAGGNRVQFQEVNGTIWNGEINGLTTGDVYLGDIAFRLRPLSLLTGAVAADVTARDGAAVGTGRVSANLFSRRVAISNASFAFDLSSVRRYSLFGIPYQGRIEARDAGLDWSRTGCSRASGEIWTDVLNASAKTLVGESLLLAGPAACADGRITIALKGGNRAGDADIMIAIDPSMTYRLIASVDLGSADLENNLRRIGFEDGDGVLVYDAVGALKGAGS